MPILEKVREIFADLADMPIEAVHAETGLRAVDQVDSLELAEFFMHVEDAFDVVLPDRECADFTTIGDVARSVLEKQAAAA